MHNGKIIFSNKLDQCKANEKKISKTQQNNVIKGFGISISFPQLNIIKFIANYYLFRKSETMGNNINRDFKIQVKSQSFP